MADEAVAAARDLIEVDARQAAAAATRIEQASHEARRLAYGLDALSAVLAVAAALLVVRALQKVRAVDAENRRLMERKAEELELFAGRVAHDVLSPLAAVSLSLAVAGRLAEHPDAREALKRGSRSLQHVSGIVDGLLEFARAGARPEDGARTEVEPLVRELRTELEPFATDHGATLAFEATPACAVPCSPGVLLSILSNLLRNAIKYLGNSSARRVRLRVERRRGRVLFEVEDTGPGIPASEAASIFRPYVRGPHAGVPGIGLGLATVKRLVESHGGAVGHRPGARGGAVFWFELGDAPEPVLASVGDEARQSA
jgi:signal transduction histidine kinase